MRPLIIQSKLFAGKEKLTQQQVEAIHEVKDQQDQRKSIEKKTKKSTREVDTEGPVEDKNPNKLQPVSGFNLTPEEKKTLLPHFSMLIVGKPGSGKSTLMQQLVNSPKFYANRFNKVFVVSPSISKLDIPIPKDHMSNTFDMDWVYDKILNCNKDQETLILDVIRQKLQQVHVNKQLQQNQTHKDVSLNELYQNVQTYTQGPVGLSAQLITNRFRLPGLDQAQTQSRFMGDSMLDQVRRRDIKQTQKLMTRREKQDKLNTKVNSIVSYGDSVNRKFMETLKDQEQLYNTHKHVLFIFDDVVGDIKALEHDPSLTKLFFNRRHLIANGTISIILVSQKFTSIPQKIRTNSNWFILFRLNPVEFENVWKDAIVLSRDHWSKLIEDVFGTEEEDIALSKLSVDEQIKKRRYDNLGIWVEFSNFMFKNFERLAL